MTISNPHSQRPAPAGVQVATIMAGFRQDRLPIALKADLPDAAQALSHHVTFRVSGIVSTPASDHVPGRHDSEVTQPIAGAERY